MLAAADMMMITALAHAVVTDDELVVGIRLYDLNESAAGGCVSAMII